MKCALCDLELRNEPEKERVCTMRRNSLDEGTWSSLETNIELAKDLLRDIPKRRELLSKLDANEIEASDFSVVERVAVGLLVKQLMEIVTPEKQII